MSQANDIVGQRAELLARVLLTRRMNIDVHAFGDKSDKGIDFICTIRSDKVPGFLPFAVVVWGTAKELGTESRATAFGRNRKKAMKPATFFMPVVVLVFSVQKDEGYFSWLVEPCKEGRKLLQAPQLKFKVFDLKQLNRMVNRITSWYKRLAEDIVTETGKAESAECPHEA